MRVEAAAKEGRKSTVGETVSLQIKVNKAPPTNAALLAACPLLRMKHCYKGALIKVLGRKATAELGAH